RNESRNGTRLDGAALARGAEARLPERFRLELGGALALEGALGAPAPDGPAAILLRREGNFAHQAYLWVRRDVTLGPDPGDLLRLSSGAARLRVHDGSITAELPAGATARPFALGDEARE
ncbi:MAG TPA: hypothetical protein VHF22_01670, partial [Planctomycetota bacterium]|nr:hypothetical protein [Planctomycetota bacterium]